MANGIWGLEIKDYRIQQQNKRYALKIITGKYVARIKVPECIPNLVGV